MINIEPKGLVPIIVTVVLAGILVGIGIIATNSIGTATWTEATYTENITVTYNTTTSLTKDYIIDFDTAVNATTLALLGSGNYSIDKTNGEFTIVQDVGDGSFMISGGSIKVNYTYKDFAEETRDAMDDLQTEFGYITSNWFGLIITIAVLAVIMLLVMRSFTKR